MKKIAFFNLKGGVGKTTSAVNIAWHAAQEGIPCLLWDLDPQGAASWLLQRKAKSKSQPKKVLAGKTAIGELVKTTDFPNLDIIPADFSFRKFDILLADHAGKGNPVDKLLAPFSEQYALVILDCPPSFSTLSEQIFDTADALYMPLIPTHLSLRTFEQTRDFFKQNNLKPKRLHAFFNMVDRRRTMHRTMLAHPPQVLKHGLATSIPYAAVIEKMGDFQAPLPAFAANTPVAKAYQQLWQDIKSTLNTLN